MALYDAIVWTAEMDALIGTLSDAKVGVILDLAEARVRYRRKKLNLPTYRSSRAPVTVPCAGCGKESKRKYLALGRSRRLFCSLDCANAAQKKRDTDMLRYGPGWKNRRAEIRARDKNCQACGKTPEQNNHALHVHHLKPYRLGGSNHPLNLVALCDTCHHIIEALTATVLDSIQIGVSLEGSSLTITVEGVTRWQGSVAGAVCRTKAGQQKFQILAPPQSPLVGTAAKLKLP